MNAGEERALPRVCAMAVYFEPLPPWFGLWAASCVRNSGIDFLVVTDQESDALPVNVRALSETLDGVKGRLEVVLRCKVALSRLYKLCDYEPFLGLVFADELTGYDYWGFADLDLVFGDLEGFFREQDLWRHDKFLPLGHPFLFRNASEVNVRVELPAHGEELWRRVVDSDENQALDEFGINEIYVEHVFPAHMGRSTADITIALWHFTLGIRFDMRDGGCQASMLHRYPNYKRQVFYWRDGRAGWLALDHGEMVVGLFLYAHFQKWRFTKEMVRVKPGDDFYFDSEGFMLMAGLDAGAAFEVVNPHGTFVEMPRGCSSMPRGFSVRQGWRSSVATMSWHANQGSTDFARLRLAGDAL